MRNPLLKNKRGKATILGLMFFLVFVFFMFPVEPEVIEEPKPTHVEKEYKKLVLVKEIVNDINNEVFMVSPSSVTVDNHGNIYVFDKMLKKIFKFDKNLKFIKFFMREGDGPGEISGFRMGLGYRKIYYAKDGNLYISDPYHRKVASYTCSGEHFRDFRIDSQLRSFHPVVDKSGNFFTTSFMDGAVDVFNKKGEKEKTLLTPLHYDRFFYYKPTDEHPHPKFDSWIIPTNMNTFYDLVADSRLLVYLTNSSTAYIFENNRQVDNYDLWPKKALEIDKKSMLQSMEGRNGKKNWYRALFHCPFVDKDDEKHFYLTTHYQKKDMIYKFDLKGNLVTVLWHDSNALIHTKRNNLFYGLSEEGIHLFKEVK